MDIEGSSTSWNRSLCFSNFRQVARVPIGRTETERRLRKEFVNIIKIIFIKNVFIFKNKNIIYSNINMKLPELKTLLVRNNIKGGTYLYKAELIKLLITNNVIIDGNETHQPVIGQCKISEEDVQHQVLMDEDRMEEVERLQNERRKKYQ